MTTIPIQKTNNDFEDVVYILASMNEIIKNRDLIKLEYIQSEKNYHDSNSNYAIALKTINIVKDKFGINSNEYQYQLNRFLYFSNKKDEAEYKYEILKDKLKDKLKNN
jgi:hypothetical protein